VSDLVEAARFDNRIEADLARMYLDQEGIDAILFDTAVNQLYGGMFLPVRLMVLGEDLATAQRLLETRS
jgi:hypothetical protein